MKHTQTVFYSWQADLPNRTNRGFIEDALERAAKALRADDSLKVELRIDRDTADVAGSPAIADTILQKIANAEIFVPDVSIVARTTDGKACPNPNVLVELGYAVSRLGWDRIIMVMNTAFGPTTELPFDLRGHRVMPYVLPDAPGSPKAEERRSLEEKLVNAMAAILG
jgi:predicted nucleotide-binding protein